MVKALLLPNWVITHKLFFIMMKNFLAMDPNDKTALDGKGFALYYLGDYTQAIQYYDNALDVDPKDR